MPATRSDASADAVADAGARRRRRRSPTRPSAPPPTRARCSSAPRKQPRTARADGGRSAHRGGAGRRGRISSTPSGCRTTAGELHRPGRRRQAPGSGRRRPRRRRTPGRRLAGRSAERPRHGAAGRRHALCRPVARRPVDRPWRAREAGRRTGRRQFRHGPPRRAGRAAHARRAQRGPVRRIPRRCAGRAGRRNSWPTANATKAASAPASATATAR